MELNQIQSVYAIIGYDIRGNREDHRIRILNYETFGTRWVTPQGLQKLAATKCILNLQQFLERSSDFPIYNYADYKSGDVTRKLDYPNTGSGYPNIGLALATVVKAVTDTTVIGILVYRATYNENLVDIHIVDVNCMRIKEIAELNNVKHLGVPIALNWSTKMSDLVFAYQIPVMTLDKVRQIKRNIKMVKGIQR